MFSNWESEVLVISKMYVEGDYTIRSLGRRLERGKSLIYNRLLACEDVDHALWLQVDQKLKSNQVEGRKRGGAASARKKWAKKNWALNVK